jgi:hypothetical protein
MRPKIPAFFPTHAPPAHLKIGDKRPEPNVAEQNLLKFYYTNSGV